MRWKPHAYQRQAIKFMIDKACAGLLLDPGLGKTSITYAAFKILKSQGMVEKMLVIAPLRPAHSVWPAEAVKWEEFNGLRVVVLHGDDKAARLAEEADVYVINPEGLPWLETALAKVKPWPFDMLVVDESTRFKHANTQRFKKLKPMLPRFKRRYILTGSPAPNGLLDLFGQIFILDLGRALGQYITHYRMTYFDNPDRMGWNWVPRPGSERVIYDRIKPLALRMDGRDLLDMPPLIGVDPPLRVEVELPPAARKAYDEMEKTMLAAVEDDLITAANAAAATVKCRQIANGGIYTDMTGEKWSHIHEAKVDAVEEIIEELQGKPALVAYEFRHDLDRLQRRFGRDTPFIGGGVSPRKFREIENAWNAGDIPLLLAQPQSVAHGLNLQGVGAAVIWHSLTWDLEVYEQFIRRVWRQGQKERIVVHHLVAPKTIDEVILKSVGKKDRTQRSLLSALKEYAQTKSPKRRTA